MATEQLGKFGGGGGALVVGQAGGRDMGVKMILNQLVHQSCHRAPHRRDQVQRLGAIGIGDHRSLDGRDLSRDPADAGDDLFLAGRHMCHNA